MIRLLTILSLIVVLSPLPSASANEGAGLLYSDLTGALPKGLWRKQNRSEITALLKDLPASGPSRAIQGVKRNMLISNYDVSVIENDAPINSGYDLLTLRLNKLYEMGLWEDAFKLYTQTTEDPGNNNALAQVGLLLILNQKGMSTACLEEKVLNARFAEETFWKQIDRACSIELGIETSEDNFPESSVLQQAFFTNGFKVNANDVGRLNNLNLLEIAILSEKGKIDYKTLDSSQKYSPLLIKTFLEDDNFPDKFKPALERQAYTQGLGTESALSEQQLKWLETPDSLSQSQVKSLIATQLHLGKEASPELSQRLLILAPQHPENYFFLHMLQKTSSFYGNFDLTEDNINFGTEAVMKKYPQKAKLLKSVLDKPVEFSNNLVEVYEKQISLTPNDGYVMSTGSSTKRLADTAKQGFVGLSLLIILSNIEDIANGSGEITPINSLSTVGLIDQAHYIARYELANMMKL